MRASLGVLCLRTLSTIFELISFIFLFFFLVYLFFIYLFFLPLTLNTVLIIVKALIHPLFRYFLVNIRSPL